MMHKNFYILSSTATSFINDIYVSRCIFIYIYIFIFSIYNV